MPRKLNPLLAKKLSQLSAPLAAEDFDELVLINELAWQVTAPGPETMPHFLLDLKARCGNVVLYPVTLGAHLWHSGVAGDWWDDDSYWGSLLTLFVLAHARGPDVFDALNCKHVAKKAIRKWMKHAGATSDELVSAAARLLRYDQARTGAGDDDGDEAAAYGPVLRFLTKEHGGTIKHWMWGENLEVMKMLLESRAAELVQEGRQTRKNIGANKAAAAPSTDCPFQKAHARWFDVWCKFRNRKEGVAE